MSNLTIPNAVANGIAADGNELDANFDAVKSWADNHAVEKSGATFTGAVVLHADPSVALGAATKQYVDNSMPPGAITAYVAAAAPTGWLLCQGQEVSRATYATLYAVIGNTYGAGNGTTTFNLPNLKGRVPIGLDSSDTSFDALAETGGAKTHTLAEANLPSHTHSINHDHASVTSGSGGSHNHGPSGGGIFLTQPASGSLYTQVSTSLTANDVYYGSASVTDTEAAHTHTVDLPSFSGTSGSTGSGTAVTHLDPYLVVNFIIKT